MRGTRSQNSACRLAVGRQIVKAETCSAPRVRVGLAIALTLIATSFLRAAEPGDECPAEFPVLMHPENLDCPYHGFIIRGAAEGGGAGYSVASAGDINNDGIDDLIVGTGSTFPLLWWSFRPPYNPAGTGAGEAYIIFGAPELTTLATFELANLDGSNGFKFVGLAPNERFGLVVARAGDINNDGIDDVLISNAEGEPSGDVYIGHTYVVFGQPDIGSGGAINLAELDGTNGFVAVGLQSGHSVSAAGDINADGIDDLLIGAPTNRPPCSDHLGRAYLIFGGAGDWPPVVALGDLAGSTGVNGTNGLAIQARPNGDHCANGPYAALAVAGLGDVDQDGLDDLIVGVSGDNSGPSWATGACSIVFGGAGDWPAVVNAVDLAGQTGINGTNGFMVSSPESEMDIGFAVSRAGDVNHDGIVDTLIGAPAVPHNGWIGCAYIVFGSADVGESGFINVEDLDGNNGFAVEGVLDGPEPLLMLGSSVTGAGDLNGDGFDDLLLGTGGVGIGILGGGDNRLHIRDEAFVVFGGPEVGANGSILITDLNGSNGFKFEGAPEPEDRSETSRSVASAGDLNADGFDDIVIGAPGAGDAGEAYVLWGCPQLGSSDCNDNHITDACETDCNGNGILDECDIEDGTSPDSNSNGIPDECECLADLDSDGGVGSFDLALLLGSWGPCVDPEACPADLDGDGAVGPFDLALLLGGWGQCE